MYTHKQEQMIKESARHGATFLDGKRESWFLEVNLQELDMGSPYRCILGQLYIDFQEGIEVLEIPYNFCKKGFSMLADLYQNDGEEEEYGYVEMYYHILQEEWELQIITRRDVFAGELKSEMLLKGEKS